MKLDKVLLSVIIISVLTGCSARSLIPNSSGDPIVAQEVKEYQITAIYPESMEIDLTDLLTGQVYTRQKLNLCGAFDKIKVGHYVKIQENTYSKHDNTQYKKIVNVRDSICGDGVKSIF